MTDQPEVADAALVQRLRNILLYEGSGEESALPEEAADRIDALKAENERLRSVFADLMSWFPDEPSPPEWRIEGGKYGADDAVADARAALTPS